MSKEETKYKELTYIDLESIVDDVEKEQEYVLIDMHRQKLSKEFEQISTFEEERQILYQYFQNRFMPITDEVFRLVTFPDNYKYDFEKNKDSLTDNFIKGLKNKSKRTTYGNGLYTKSYSYNSLNTYNTNGFQWQPRGRYRPTFTILRTALLNYKDKFKKYVLEEIEKDRGRFAVYITYGMDLKSYPEKTPFVYVDDTKNLMTKEGLNKLDNKIKVLLTKLTGQCCLYYVESFVSYYLGQLDEIDVHQEKRQLKDKLASYSDLVSYPSKTDVDSPEFFIGDMYDIIQKMPKGVTIKNVETIMRPDLLWRFKKYHEMLKGKYGTQSKYCKIEVAFHGTRIDRLYNIIERGLIIPNSDNGLDAFTCGARYGNGIYLSPDAGFSMHYCRGDTCLLVCAVLPGKKYVCKQNSWNSNLTSGHDSHVSSDNTELILFDEAQILPCVVIHYDNESNTLFGEKKVKYRDQMKNMNKKEKKEFIQSFGYSLLPYGFGRQKANKCEFLDVTFPDDSDEEDTVVWYGDIDNEHYNMFQPKRYTHVKENFKPAGIEE